VALFEKTSPAAEKARRAIDDLKKRLKDRPDDVSAALALADAQAGAGERGEALALLLKLGRALQKQGRALETIAVFKKVVALDPKGEHESTFLAKLDLERLQQAVAKVSSPAPTAPAPAAHPPGANAASAGPAAAEPVDPAREKRRRVQTAASGIPLLKDMPPFLLELILEKMELATYLPPRTVFEEGAEGSSLVFVVTGGLGVSARDEKGRVLVLGSLGPGAVAGEISFLSGTPRTATLTATERSDVLLLERRALDPILKKHRPLADALQSLFKERVLDTILARSPIFAKLPRDERDFVAQHLASVDAKPGERIVEEGAHDDALYLIKRGQLRVSMKKGGKEVALALLAPHDFFGDVAALRGIRRTASVTAVTPAELLRLPREALVALLARRPEIRSAFEEIQLGRFVATSAALSKS